MAAFVTEAVVFVTQAAVFATEAAASRVQGRAKAFRVKRSAFRKAGCRGLSTELLSETEKPARWRAFSFFIL
jgi:hypothetical protein